MAKDNFAWIRDLERQKGDSIPGEFWQSSIRYDFTQPWSELSQTVITNFERGPSKGHHTVGSAIGNLKRLWKSYKWSGSSGSRDRREIAFNINEVQFVLGVPLTEMSESYDPEWVLAELELKYGKQEEQDEVEEERRNQLGVGPLDQ